MSPAALGGTLGQSVSLMDRTWRDVQRDRRGSSPSSLWQRQGQWCCIRETTAQVQGASSEISAAESPGDRSGQPGDKVSVMQRPPADHSYL